MDQIQIFGLLGDAGEEKGKSEKYKTGLQVFTLFRDKKIYFIQGQ